ncbi:hypothetical protein D9M71_781950 [compost metagenome]
MPLDCELPMAANLGGVIGGNLVHAAVTNLFDAVLSDGYLMGALDHQGLVAGNGGQQVLAYIQAVVADDGVVAVLTNLEYFVT